MPVAPSQKESRDAHCSSSIPGRLVVNKDLGCHQEMRVAHLEPGDFFGEMTLLEMQNRSATVAADTPSVLHELTARSLYMYYKADVHAYVLVMQNINRELCRRLRRADDRIAEILRGNT